MGCLYFCASANPIKRRFKLFSFNLAFYIIFIYSLFFFAQLTGRCTPNAMRWITSP
nr:MAG TPA: hypothetical protein [Caudoviricetes sp.]